MSKILDLSVYQEETFDITFPDKSIVRVRKPTQAVVIEMMRLSHQNQEYQEEMIDAMIDLCAVILNNNIDGKKFSKDGIGTTLDFIMVAAIVKGYTDWTKELQSNPF